MIALVPALLWLVTQQVPADKSSAEQPAPSPTADCTRCGRDGQNRQVTIENRSGQAVSYLYAGSRSRDQWQEDALGDKMIEPAATVTLNFDDGSGDCYFDIRIELADGTSIERRNFNVCRERVLTLAPD